MRTVLLCTLCLAATACFAQSTLTPSVVVGEDAQGRNEIVTIIPLKYLDPGDAADLLMALGFTGVIAPPIRPHAPGEFPGSYGTGFNRRSGTRPGGGYYGRNRGGSQGYDGYRGALERSQQYPGYQSPYDYR